MIWRRFLRVTWTARRSNQSILKEINLEYSFSGLKLKLQLFGHLIRRADSLEKTLMLGKIEGRRGRGNRRQGNWMASPTQWTWVWASSRRWWWTREPGVLPFMRLQRVVHSWATEQQQSHSVTDTHSFSYSFPLWFSTGYWIYSSLCYTVGPCFYSSFIW